GGYQIEAAEVRRFSQHGDHGQRYYTRRNAFTAETIDIDRAEFARVHLADLPSAESLYARAASSGYPLKAALGHLGLALVPAQRRLPQRPAETAARLADHTGCRLVAQRAQELLAPSSQVQAATREVFFC